MEKPRKSVFPVGVGGEGQNTAKNTSFQAEENDPRNQFSQVVQKELQTNIQRIACYHGE